jgi:hypothetical protein
MVVSLCGKMADSKVECGRNTAVLVKPDERDLWQPLQFAR